MARQSVGSPVMITQVYIADTKGPCFYTHADFPLTIGSQADADIHIVGGRVGALSARLLIVDNRVCIDPQDKTAKILINHSRVSDQQEIRHDDLVRVGDSTFRCEHIGGILSLSLHDDQSYLVSNPQDIAVHGELIRPIPLPEGAANLHPNKKFRRLISIGGVVLFILLAIAMAYVFTAKTLLIEVEPSPDSIALSGKLWPLKVKGRYLVQPGSYTLQVAKSGYLTIQTEIKVTRQPLQTLAFSLLKKPGYLDVSSAPQEHVQVSIGGRNVGMTPLEKLQLDAGSYVLQAHASRYLPYSTQVVIEGKAQHQSLHIEMLANWAEVSINSDPDNAEVWIDGMHKGVTPLTLDLGAGNYNLELRHPDYLPYATGFVVVANEGVKLPIAKLFSSASHLIITSAPSKAVVSLAGVAQGTTPLTLRLTPNTEHTLTLSRAGYRDNQQNISLKPGEQQSISAKLEAILGSVILNIEPQDSEIFINGKFLGSGSLKLSLPSSAHKLEVRKSGYEVYEKMIAPDANIPQALNVNLNRITQVSSIDKPSTIHTSQGHELKLIFGGQFSMGAARREQGRRSNETLHTVNLQRPFYISTAEVTNAQFASFMATHSSGTYKGNDLSAPNLPVVNISWEDAARYCNWLSEKEGLDKVYHEQNGGLVSVHPLSSGYRLLTESEWAWVARKLSASHMQNFAWGGGFPPKLVSGNYADQSASGILDETIEGYDDGFAVAAPVASFKANRFGIFDLGGNVGEWCHDFHGIYPSLSEEVLMDPLGPSSGSSHVIRGASWMRGDISSTRLSHRDHSNKKRPDVGFRIAKYID